MENLAGGSRNDTLTGDGLANTLSGGAGADTLTGEAGDDLLAGGSGADLLNGGDGYDTISDAASSAGIEEFLWAGGVGGDAQGDIYTDVESVIGSAFAGRTLGQDHIGETFKGGAGNDELYCFGGNDILEGAYVLKGASPDAASEAGLERLEPGGRVIGKRCGTFQNTSAKVRKEKD